MIPPRPTTTPRRHPWRDLGPQSPLLFLVALLLGLGAWPGDGPAAPLQDQQTLTVPINKSRILDLRQAIARVSVADPTIADILVINPKQIYINGKELGATNMILWDERDQVVRQIGLEVTYDLESLKEKLYRLLPGERIRVESAQKNILLSGTASSPARMEAALQVAKTYDKNAINLLQVGGAQQVLLEVRVAEVVRTLGKELDSNLLTAYDDGNGFRVGLINGLYDNKNRSILPLDNLSNALITAITSGNFTLDMYLKAAEAEGLGRILAEPNLTTLSGQEANFLSGGQIPYTTTSTNGATNTEWKNYGIELMFVPFVMDSGRINLKVNVSVSEPGPESLSNGQKSTSIVSRGANATVEVPSGQTIAIAGLLSEKATDSSSKFPGLGEVPILGALFRSTSLKSAQTELIIFVTPRLANSFDPKQVRLPTEGFVEPSDVEFYLMGKIPGRRPAPGKAVNPKAAPSQRLGPDKQGTEGLFGHDL